MRDNVLRGQIDGAFETAFTLLPTTGPLARFRAELEELKRDYTLTRPRVMLAGRAGSGKSALANALLEEDLLPRGGAGSSTTRTVTWLRHAPDKTLTVHFTDGSARPAAVDQIHDLARLEPAAFRQRFECPVPAAYLEVGHPSELLTAIDLIDTPSLDEWTTRDFLDTVGADAVIMLVKLGRLAESDVNLLREFRRVGVTTELASPLNAIGVLNLDSVEHDGDYTEAMSLALTLSAEQLDGDAARRLLYHVHPMHIHAALGAGAFDDPDFTDLKQLVKHAAASGAAGLADLISRAADGADFRAAQDGGPINPERRSELFNRFGRRYGIEMACLAMAHSADASALRAELAARSGLTAFLALLSGQFAWRADLIKTYALIARVERNAARLSTNAQLTGWDYSVLDQVSGLFRNQVAVAWDRSTVISDCRANRLQLSAPDIAAASRILGEPGQSAKERLHAPADAQGADVAALAKAKRDHWARLDAFPFNGDTKRACRVVLRACEELITATRLD